MNHEEKMIRTPELHIEGNVMYWENTMIQLSNVSCISSAPLKPLKFPIWVIFLLVAGTVCIKEYLYAAITMLVVGAAIIFVWWYINNARAQKRVLTISVNSGLEINICFSNESFLDKVLQVLEKIIYDGGIGEHSLYIDIHDANISGGANVLNNLQIDYSGRKKPQFQPKIN